MNALTAALKVITFVTELDFDRSLRNTQQDAALRSFLGKVLSSHPSLQMVDLGINEITDTHAAWIGGEAIKTNNSLKELNFFST